MGLNCLEVGGDTLVSGDRNQRNECGLCHGRRSPYGWRRRELLGFRFYIDQEALDLARCSPCFDRVDCGSERLVVENAAIEVDGRISELAPTEEGRFGFINRYGLKRDRKTRSHPRELREVGGGRLQVVLSDFAIGQLEQGAMAFDVNCMAEIIEYRRNPAIGVCAGNKEI